MLWVGGGEEGRRGEGGEKKNKATSLTTDWTVNCKSVAHSIHNDRFQFMQNLICTAQKMNFTVSHVNLQPYTNDIQLQSQVLVQVPHS